MPNANQKKVVDSLKDAVLAIGDTGNPMDAIKSVANVIDVSRKVVGNTALPSEKMRQIVIGNNSYVLDEKGEIQVSARESGPEFYKPNSLHRAVVDYSSDDQAANAARSTPLTVNGVVDGLALPAGIIVIMGGGSTGKTPLLHYLLKKTRGLAIRYGEPLPGFIRTEKELALTMLTADNTVIGVDSFKNVMGRLGGASTARGISREIFATLSDLGSIYASYDRSLLTPFNISSDRSDAIAEIYEAVRSNATMVISATESPGQFVYLARTGDGLKRRTGSIRLEWQDDGVVAQLTHFPDEGGDPSSQERSFIERALPPCVGDLSSDVIANAVRRYARSNLDVSL